MATDASEYLAAHVLNEQQPVSYRNLSRALKVHVNQAKQLLKDFYQKQNARRAGSVHATYILSGKRRLLNTSVNDGTDSAPSNPANGQHNDENDIPMQSSPPFPGSSLPPAVEDVMQGQVPIQTILIVREEHLEQAKETFESITGLHIYSLQAKGLSDINVLTDCNRRVVAETAGEDPLETWKQYGTIHNPHARRRAGGAAPPPVVRAATAKASAPVKPAESNSLQTKPGAADPSPAPVQDTSRKPIKKPAGPNSLFSSFAKQSAQPRKAKANAPTEEPTDVAMGGFSDDEEEEDGAEGLPDDMKDVVIPTGKSKKEREADLQAMMDVDDDEVEADATDDDDSAHEDGDVRMDEDAHASEPPAAPAPEPQESVIVENGRRRGRRRIMKKKTVRDEEGYLVTREEAAWESFSEDEPAVPKPKPTSMTSTTNSNPANPPGANGKKTAAPKAAQGNIMSFFTKK